MKVNGEDIGDIVNNPEVALNKMVEQHFPPPWAIIEVEKYFPVKWNPKTQKFEKVK